MKIIYPLLSLLLACFTTQAQVTNVWDGISNDSLVFSFAPGDSLIRHGLFGAIRSIDTAGCRLWQIGSTTKAGFVAGSIPVRGIMTDTTVNYPVGQNDYFVLKGWNNYGQSPSINPILTFEHRYQTAAGRDGGSVEISPDSGTTWMSIFQLCNDTNTNNNPNFWESIFTDSFYTRHDTLANGIPAFSGNSNGYITSRLQLFWGLAIKPSLNKSAAAPCSSFYKDLWLRFRFFSDSTADTLAGWNIRRIVFERDLYAGAVKNIFTTPRLLLFSPNPAADGIFRIEDDFEITPDQRYEVRNMLGSVLQVGRLERTISLSSLPRGLYWIMVQGKAGTAAGKVMRL